MWKHLIFAPDRINFKSSVAEWHLLKSTRGNTQQWGPGLKSESCFSGLVQ